MRKLKIYLRRFEEWRSPRRDSTSRATSQSSWSKWKDTLAVDVAGKLKGLTTKNCPAKQSRLRSNTHSKMNTQLPSSRCSSNTTWLSCWEQEAWGNQKDWWSELLSLSLDYRSLYEDCYILKDKIRHWSKQKWFSLDSCRRKLQPTWLPFKLVP